jgi:dihydroorotate dehydrogenase (NAD+) catalytic subunit
MTDSRADFFAVEPDRTADLSVDLGGLRLANPVMPASGCFGPELADLVPVAELGALVTKTVFTDRRSGNPAHRLTESLAGMVNSVGIPSPGSRSFIDEVLPRYLEPGVPVIVSAGGLQVREYWTLVEELTRERHSAIELNVSCPNLEHGGVLLGTDPRTVEELVAGAVARSAAPVLVKLTPMVTDIADIARAAEAGGAAAVTVANTLPSLLVDVDAHRPVLGHGFGGMSGPAVKPIVLKLVHDIARSVTIPVVGCGGVATADDVAAYLIAGARAVQVGTANFARPFVMAEIVRDLSTVCARLGVTRLADIVNTLDI